MTLVTSVSKGLCKEHRGYDTALVSSGIWHTFLVDPRLHLTRTSRDVCMGYPRGFFYVDFQKYKNFFQFAFIICWILLVLYATLIWRQRHLVTGFTFVNFQQMYFLLPKTRKSTLLGELSYIHVSWWT